MPQNRYRGPPMTLANMRAQGVRSAGASFRSAHGVHVVRHHWRIRPAELPGAPNIREPDGKHWH